MRKKKVFQIIVSVSFISFLVFMFNYSAKRDKYIIENGITTYGEIYKVTVKKVWYSYILNGKKYIEDYNKPYTTIYPGEIFEVKYAPDRPSDDMIFFERPVFPKGVELNTSYAEHISIPMPLDLPEIKYYYKVDGKEYERWQRVPSKDIDLNKRYIVKYRVDRPEIGYIFFDEQ